MADQFGCVGNTIRLRSNHYIDLANPKPDQFEFSDIAGGLSKLCRFGGQCEWFYSVAEHCYWACSLACDHFGLSLKEQAACLLHDAAEAFLGDVVKPLKIILPDYSEIEQRMERVIEDKFGVALHNDYIRTIDRALLIAERRQLFTPDGIYWQGQDTVPDLKVSIQRWDCVDAEDKFFDAARRVGIDVTI